MVKKMLVFTLICFLFYGVVFRAQPGDIKDEEILEGRWEGRYCMGAPEGGVVMKFVCLNLSLRFDQTGEHIFANGTAEGFGGFSFKGIASGRSFYGSTQETVFSKEGGGEFFVLRGFFDEKKMQLLLDTYNFKENKAVWSHGGTGTLEKKETE